MRNPFTVFRRCRELEEENSRLRDELEDLRHKQYASAFIEGEYLPKINGTCRSCIYVARAADSLGRPFYVGCQKKAMCSDYKPNPVTLQAQEPLSQCRW